jgi:hypothetical protein
MTVPRHSERLEASGETAMTKYGNRKGYMTGEKRCIFCGAGGDYPRLLNPKAEFKGGLECFYYRCGSCRRYFVEYWISGEFKMAHGA